MALKQSVPINFSQGLDTKSDPKQVQVGKFLSLQNSVFTTAGMLQKRNGYSTLSQVMNDTPTYLTTFGGNLTSIGSKLNAYVPGSQTWVNKGTIHPIALKVSPLARSQFNQTQCDAVMADNGLVCTVYTEINNGVSSFKYSVQNAESGQYIVSPTTIPSATQQARVFLLGGHFIIVSTNTSTLQYVAVSTNNPSIVTANTSIDAVTSTAAQSWDGAVYGNVLYLAYNVTAGGQAINVIGLTQGLTVTAAVPFAAQIATNVSVAVDISSGIIYVAYYDAAGNTGYVLAVNLAGMTIRMSPTQIIAALPRSNITLTASNGVATVVTEVTNAYGYDSSILTNYLAKVSVTLPATVTTGTVGSPTILSYSVGLASKAFLMNGEQYVLATYMSSLQNTYFLLDSSGNVVSKFAYENGGGYLTTGLPQARVIGSTVNIAYLYKDLIQSQSTAGLVQSIGTPGLSNIYSQTGVNLASLDFTSTVLTTAEIGSNLNLSGGMLYAYDGNTLNEQGFHLFPDNIKVTQVANSGPTTGDISSTSTPTIVKNVNGTTGMAPGMTITDSTNPSAIPAGTTIVSVDGPSQLTMSAAATASHTGDTLVVLGAMTAQQYYYQVLYEWTDAQGNIFRSAPSVPVSVTVTSGHTSVLLNIPTLRLTYKSGVKIVIYRWAVDQQSYYQVTSVTAPLMNNPTGDSVSFQDVQSSAQILGNSLIYTTGGVVENIGGPACTAITLFDDRLWLIDAEDQNLLWYSKQVIQSTPVEMSDLFTLFIAPTTGAQGSTGVMKCLFPMDDKLIIFKKDAIYWMNGAGPDNTGSNSSYSQPIFITGGVGCENPNSIVMTDAGLMFQSDKGIWLLARSGQASYIGAPVEQYNSILINSALSIPGTTQVRFTLANGIMLMYDYFYGQWGTFVGAPAISSTLYSGLHTYVSSTGRVSQESIGSYMDNGNPVLLQFTTSWLHMAGISGYERIYELLLTGSYMSPHKLQVQIGYDFGEATQQSVIKPTNFSGNYGTDNLYGQTTPFGGPSALEQWRVHAQRQKCQAFQLSVQETFDPTFSTVPSAGLTLSGINCVVGIKKSYRPIKVANSVG